MPLKLRLIWLAVAKITAVTSIAGLPGGKRNNNGRFNNVGNNGNWWSASQNNTSNAWNRNLNYNNGNLNRNNNNKKNGFSVRCLRDLMETGPLNTSTGFLIIIMQLNLFKPASTLNFSEELFQAYFDCRRNKRNTIKALSFEKHFEEHLFQLKEVIQNGNYQPSRSIAFVVDKPVKREIFAADFKDRVVHHLVINKLNPLFEKEFINDSYACRVGKGTHFGINRVAGFIKNCSHNYTKDCYILKLDILGFFIHINRNVLFERLEKFIQVKYHEPDKELLIHLCKQIIFNDPTQNCTIMGSIKNWEGLPNNKSLFHSAPGCGLPIGNLTSQVFANFYLNSLDHFIKYNMGIKYFGRYVDDFVIIHPDKEYLKMIISLLSNYLSTTLQLTLHPKKQYLQHYTKGVLFLGSVIKPNRIYIGNRTKGNFYNAIQKQNLVLHHNQLKKEILQVFLSSMNSYLGIMKHYKTYRLRMGMIFKYLNPLWWKYVFLVGDKFGVKK